MKHAFVTALVIALVVALHPLSTEAGPVRRQVRADPPRVQTSNIDLEVARVKKMMRDIQDQPIARDAKIQKQRTLLESEMARTRTQMREIQEAQESKEERASARDRQKQTLDDMRKLLDILRSMNAKLLD